MSTAIAVGTVLAETYEVTSLLGRGGMGAVWEARHLRLPGKRVAIKVLLADALADTSVYARFRREAEIASRLGHPNIVEAIDWNTLPDGTPYIVLELLGGESLSARLKRGPLTLAATVAIARQISSALLAAHRAGIVHRDLKPDNVFLCPGEVDGAPVDRVKVLDFGISKIRDSKTVQTQAEALLGTPQYMSPEQAAGRHAQVDARTDQFALAAMVYEMLSGTPAFGGETLVEVVVKVMMEQPPSLPGLVPSLPPRVVSAVERALSKKAEERFDDVRAFVEELAGRPLATLDGPGVTASLAVPSRAPAALAVPSRAPAAAKRPSRIGLVAAGVGLVAAAAVAWGVMAHRSEPRVDAVNTTAATTVKAPVSAPSVVAAPAPVVVPLPAAPSPAPVVAPAPQQPDPAAPAPVAHAGVAAHAHGAAESLPPEIAAALDAADAALTAGNSAEARRLARGTMTTRKTARAFAIVARSFCKDGNLGDARAQLDHVGSERGRVLRECHAAGVDLQ